MNIVSMCTINAEKAKKKKKNVTSLFINMKITTNKQVICLQTKQPFVPKYFQYVYWMYGLYMVKIGIANKVK